MTAGDTDLRLFERTGKKEDLGMEERRASQISDVYHHALGRPPADREAFLKEACGDDVALREEVQSLLRFHESSSEFLETPAAALVATGVQSKQQMTGHVLGHYTLKERIGIGGMGEVYRAHDSTLRRDVAIKILSAHFVADPERRARFTREARVLATMNHPNIGAIYGLEERDGITGLVLELVEGETLDRRLERGPLRIDEAVVIARQIAEALSAAHEKGIIHRDLKPSNIALQSGSGLDRRDVQVKVLDFGLAKPVTPDGDRDATQRSDSFDGSTEGRILGTPAYMSPEQARGLVVDKRTDIWAFGCVLFEMLSGKRAFEGDTVTDTLARILEREPDWTTLPADAPVVMRMLLTRCLRKDPKKRLRDIGDALIEIDDAAAATDPRAGNATAASAQRLKRERLAWIIAAAFLCLAVAALVWKSRAGEPRPGEVVQFTIVPPGSSANPFTDRFEISPDGRHVAFTASVDGKRMLWVRSLDNPEPRALVGTEGASRPFWKPDGQALGFLSGGLLKTVRLDGEPPVQLCRAIGESTWNGEDVIVFGGAIGYVGGTGLQQVSARSGTPAALTSLKGDEFAHGFPSFLPDGKHFLYLAQSPASSELRVGSLTSPDYVSLGRYESNAQYAAGHLFTVRGGSLIAQSFDATTLRLNGAPSYIAPKVGSVLNRGLLSVSVSGKLAYSVGSMPGLLTWLDRHGKSLSTVGDPGTFFNLDLSSDEQHVVVSRAVQSPGARAQVDLWRIDLAGSGVMTHLTDDAGREWDPVWSPDGAQIAFTHSPTQGNAHGLYVRSADPTGPSKLLVDSGNISAPDWSQDGRFIVYTEDSAGANLWTLAMKGNRTPMEFLRTANQEGGGHFSPDNRWIAYSSNATGRFEIYVRPFPERTREFPISRNGGRAPRWRGDGKEIFFLSPEGILMAVPIDMTKGFSAGVPQKLFATPIAGEHNQYAVTKDGERFLLPVPGLPAPITVLLNWRARLGK